MTISFSRLVGVGYSDQRVSDWGVREAGRPVCQHDALVGTGRPYPGPPRTHRAAVLRMNLTRRTFLAVMDAIERGEIATLVIAHQDRVARFGVDYLEHAQNNDCDIVVANQQSLSPDQELVHDLVAVVHTFSDRLSGLRRYEKTLKDELGDGAR